MARFKFNALTGKFDLVGAEIAGGSGTANVIPMFDGSGGLVDSPFFDDEAQNALNIGTHNLIVENAIYDQTLGNSITISPNMIVEAGSGSTLTLIGNAGVHINPANAVNTQFDTGGIYFVDYSGSGIRTLQVDNAGVTTPVAGASGTFTTVDLKTVTVVNGIITAIV